MCTLIAILFPVGTAFAGNNQQKDSIETTIRQLEQQVVAGILAADTILLKSLWVPECIVNTPRYTIAHNRQAVLEIQKAGHINYSNLERTIETIQILDNIVITMGNEVFVRTNDIPGAKAGQPV